MLKLVLAALVELSDGAIDKLLILLNCPKLKAAAQIQPLAQAVFKMPVGRLYGPVLMGDAGIIACWLQTVVLAEVFIKPYWN